MTLIRVGAVIVVKIVVLLTHICVFSRRALRIVIYDSCSTHCCMFYRQQFNRELYNFSFGDC